MSEKLNDWEEKRKNYLAVTIICFIIGTYFFLKAISGSYSIKSSDLKIYENLIIADKPVFRETKGKNGRKWIEFKCINNKTTFEIASFDYKCVNDDEILNEIKEGDTISIKIIKNEIEDFDNDTSCQIHSLEKNSKEYLNITCRNEKDNKDGKLGYLLLFAISIMAGIVYSFSHKPKFFDDVNPQVLIWIVGIILFFILR